MNTLRLIPRLAVSAILLSGIALGQAHVNENLEKALVYVDTAKGLDSNPGTQAKPFKTIGRAASVALGNNQNSVGTRVTINPGTYRESIALGGSSKLTSLPITFEAATKDSVVVSGADVWTGWQPYSPLTGVYTRAWPYSWGACPRDPAGPFEQDITLRREMIIVNGVMLTQVLSLAQVGLGSFFVDEVHATIYIFPPAGTNISTATVEVPTRDTLFSAFNISNLVLRDLTFRNGNTCRNNETVRFYGPTGTNILVDGDNFNWNNAGGLGFSQTTDYTVQNSIANHNGQRGFDAFEAKDGQWTADEADYNNWRGAQGAIYGWAGGGFHFFAQHNNNVSGARLLFNMTHGVHWDTDDQNITADSLISAYNLRDGVFIEASEGPVSISNSHICFNAPLSLYYDGGLAVRVSSFVSLTGNSIANNVTSQVPVIGIKGGVPISVTNYETGQQYSLLNTNLTMNSNTIAGVANQQLFDDFDQAGTAWSDFRATVLSDSNTWWNGSASRPFTVPVPSYFTTLNWASWLSVTGQDKHSTFAQPSVDPTLPCQVKPDAPDFWFVDFDNGSLTATAGSPAQYTLILIPIGGFNGKTTLSSNGVSLIPGATKSWSKNSLNGSGTVSFTINTSSATPKGTYPVTLAAHNGNAERTVTVSLTVQ